MSYSFQLNIGNVSAPVNGGGFVDVSPFYQDSGIIRNKLDGTIFARDEFNGNLVFKDDEFDAIYSLIDENRIELKVFFNGSEIYQGNLLTNGTYNLDTKITSLGVESLDEYSNILDNADVEYNVLDWAVVSNSLISPIAYTYLSEDWLFGYQLTNILSELVKRMDSTIVIDEDSFTYLKDAANPELDRLFMVAISDNIKDTDFNSRATVGNITFNRLMDMLRNLFKIYWRLEEVSGTYYFRLKHISEVLKTVGSDPQYDLTTYENTNWSENKSTILSEPNNKFKEIQRNLTSINEDFLGVNITFERLKNTDSEIQEVDATGFYFDISDIKDFPGRYPEDSIGGWVIISTEDFTITSGAVTTFTNGTSGGSTPYDTFSYSGGNISAINLSGQAFATSNAFNTAGYRLVKVTLNLTLNSGELPYLLSDGDLLYINDVGYDFGTIFGEGLQLKEGLNEIYFVNSEPTAETHRFSLFNNSASDWSITGFNADVVIATARDGVGALSGNIGVPNVEISLANLDAKHNKYELPDKLATINNVQEDVSVLPNGVDKKKEQIPLAVPIYDQNLIDFDQLVKTNVGDTEPKRFSINFNENFAQYIGLIE